MKTLSQIPIDTEQWSESSKRSIEYRFPIPYYEDIEYQCLACLSPAVFTAQDQKYTFEVQKRYIWQRRFLCNTCYTTARALSKQHDDFSRQWIANKDKLQNDKQFMTEWLSLIEALSPYRVKNELACHIMQPRLQKLLDKLK